MSGAVITRYLSIYMYICLVGVLQLNYKHDDSESEDDYFTFVATPILEPSDQIVQELVELSGTFDIKILLRNDNAPRRVVDKVQ